jgi:two-component system chemotaxis response regulator CheB
MTADASATGDPSGPARARHVVGIGASAGGVEALTGLVRELPDDLPAAVLVVLHVSPAGTSVLPLILDRAGPLPCATAEDGEPLRPGRIYVAPPDRHLLVDGGHVQVAVGPRENGHRPAVDPLFRSLARFGPAATGVILSGTRDDGTEGLAAIKEAGGTALVQAPDEAVYDGMVRSALSHVDVDAALPVAELAAEIVRLSGEEASPMPTDDPAMGPARAESSTRYTCPECGGHLTRQERRELIRYRCEVGHEYGPDSLDGEQATAVEAALWTAIRLLGDRATLLDEMAARAQRAGHGRSADRFRNQAVEARHAGLAVRTLLEHGRVPTGGGTGVAA